MLTFLEALFHTGVCVFFLIMIMVGVKHLSTEFNSTNPRRLDINNIVSSLIIYGVICILLPSIAIYFYIKYWMYGY